MLSGDGRDARRTVAEHAIEVASGLAVLVLRLVIALGGIARAPAHIGARLCHRQHFHNAVNGPETGDFSREMLAGDALRRDQHEIADEVLPRKRLLRGGDLAKWPGRGK